MDQPNILFIYSDEQMPATMAAYGNEAIRMPHLNRLCEQATVIDRAYCSQPVCTPSRATLMSGLTPHTAQMTTNNLPLLEGTKCLPEYLPETYQTAHIGKWHLGDEIFAQHGFDHWISTEDTYHEFYGRNRDQTARSDLHHDLIRKGYQPTTHYLDWVGTRFFRDDLMRLPEPDTRPHFIADESIRFLRENADRPFALYANFLEPHMPFFGCRNHQYDPERITVPPNFMHQMDESYPLRLRKSAASIAEGYGMDVPLRTEAQWRRLIAKY